MKKKVGEYVMEELIGSGAYGEVYKGTSLKTPGEVYAIKMISKKNMSEKVFRYLEREVEILQLLNHPNIVKLADIRATDNHYYLVFEYCNGGDLSSFRKKKGGIIKEETVRYIFKQIVEGLNEVHKKNAIHRDIKLSNVLLSYPDEESRKNEKPIVKLGDFGFARLMTQVEGENASISEAAEPMSFVGTPLNMAPELFHKKPYSFKADIWSLGTILYELLIGQNCYTGMNKEDLLHNIDKGSYKIPKSIKLSTECLDFLNACLQLQPISRIKWKKLLTHDYIATDKYTEFNPEIFKAVNKISDVSFEDANNYAFSSKIRYTFFKPLTEEEKKDKGSTEEEKITISMKKMEIASPQPVIQEAPSQEEAEFVKVDKVAGTPESPEHEQKQEEFTVVSNIDKINIEEDHFK